MRAALHPDRLRSVYARPAGRCDTGVSLGCRAVSVLSKLIGLGAELLSDERIGVPLWPFQVSVARKPAPQA